MHMPLLWCSYENDIASNPPSPSTSLFFCLCVDKNRRRHDIITSHLLNGPGSYTYYLYLIYISAILTASTVETMLPIEEILITALKEHDYRDSKLLFS